MSPSCGEGRFDRDGQEATQRAQQHGHGRHLLPGGSAYLNTVAGKPGAVQYLYRIHIKQVLPQTEAGTRTRETCRLRCRDDRQGFWNQSQGCCRGAPVISDRDKTGALPLAQ